MEHDVEPDPPDPERRMVPGLKQGPRFDCLNSVSQSGTMRMLRQDDWKLVFDMQACGQLYNLAHDPAERKNLYGHPEYAEVQRKMVAELLAWTLRVQDPLPLPTKYTVKSDPRNYWTLHREGSTGDW